MENIIVATFADEAKAVEELSKLNEFDSEGIINIFNHVLIGRNSYGTYEELKNDNSSDWKTLVGMTIEELIEEFGGPIGFVVGLYTKAAVEAVGDIGHYAFERDFIDRIGKEIPDGTTAFVAQVDKDSAIFIENHLKPLGGTILKSRIYAEKDNFIRKHIQTLDAKIENAEVELKTATETEKEKISYAVAKLRNKRDSGIAKIRIEGEKKLHEFQGKLESSRRKLQKQMSRLESDIPEEKDGDGQERTKKKLGKYEHNIAKYEGKIAELKGEINELHFARAV